MNKIRDVYHRLFKAYSRQGWWPVTPDGELTPQYFVPAITEKQKFEIIIGAILTQNTSWKNVEKAIIQLNKASLIDIKKIRNIDKDFLANLIRSSGYYNEKAKKVKAIAEFLNNNTIANIGKMQTQELRNLLLSVKGVGPETADSILLYALDKPIFVIDAYTRRLVERMGIIKDTKKIDYAELQKLFMRNLPKSISIYKEYHALIVRHAKEHCRKSPVCSGCILMCKYKTLNNPAV
ncbi:MAG: endonuclease III domain-containing protein [Candidatus Woesearchaeota archaeon]